MAYNNQFIQDQIVGRVRRDGGFSTFWIEENHRRAFVATDMFASGQLVRDGGQYPWVACRIATQAAKGEK